MVTGAGRGIGRGIATAYARAGATVLYRPSGEPGSKARALALGVEASAASVLVFFDADILDVRPDHFEALAAPVLAGEAWLSCGMISYGRLRNPLFLRLPPITGLRAIRREVFDGLNLTTDSPFLSAELLIKLRARGERMAQVGVTHYPRAAGTNTGASFRKILRTFRDIFRLRWALWTRRSEVLGKPRAR